MDNKNEKNLPIEATEKAITAGNIAPKDIQKTANKMSEQQKAVAKELEKGKTNEEVKKEVAEIVNEKEKENNENVK